MHAWVETALHVSWGLALWVLGAVFFDAVHCFLHRCLRSRYRALRAVAWPHSVHHRWLDEHLQIHGELQGANIACHLVPEYLTQLAFTAAMSAFLPPLSIGVCAAVQTAVFVGLLSYRGLDINHRPIAYLDAYRPSWMALPAYHALHHVYPDAHFSAYSKLVDWVAGSGTTFRGRRFAFHGEANDVFAAALGDALRRAGARAVGRAGESGMDLAILDVLILREPEPEEEQQQIEAYIASTRHRQLPPEVWSIATRMPAGLARHYYEDRRVIYRAVVLPLLRSEPERSVANALRWLRRGACFVPATVGSALRDWRRFRRAEKVRPSAYQRPRSRQALAVV